MWKCLHDAAPRYLADLCVPAHSVCGCQQLRSTASGTPLVLRARTATGHAAQRRRQWTTNMEQSASRSYHQIRLCAPSSIIFEKLRGHSLKIYKPQVHLDVRKFFFTVRIIDIWKSLPISLLNCDTIATFKKHLDCLLKNRGYIYKLFSFFPLVNPLFFWVVS